MAMRDEQAFQSLTNSIDLALQELADRHALSPFLNEAGADTATGALRRKAAELQREVDDYMNRSFHEG